MGDYAIYRGYPMLVINSINGWASLLSCESYRVYVNESCVKMIRPGDDRWVDTKKWFWSEKRKFDQMREAEREESAEAKKLQE